MYLIFIFYSPGDSSVVNRYSNDAPPAIIYSTCLADDTDVQYNEYKLELDHKINKGCHTTLYNYPTALKCQKVICIFIVLTLVCYSSTIDSCLSTMEVNLKY